MSQIFNNVLPEDAENLKRCRVARMAAVLLSALLASAAGQEVLHVLAGQEYSIPGNFRQQKSLGNGLASLANTVPTEQFTDCQPGCGDLASLHQFHSEDVEKQKNISLADYQGQVVLVVNLASF